MDVAVIGTGPAAFAAVNALLRHADAQRIKITLIGPADPRPRFTLRGKDPRTWTPEEYDALHKQLKQLGGSRFPPPRTQHGSLLTPCVPDSRINLYRTNQFGGLGEFWSTAMFPFREQELENWPLGFRELRPHYQSVADLVGIAGDVDGFSDLYPESFVNRDAVKQTPLACHFSKSLKTDRSSDFRLAVGANQLAVETRSTEPNACEYCGGCFYGCFKDALFRPSTALQKLIDRDRIEWIPEAVHSVSRSPAAGLRLTLADGSSQRFEKALLCSGAIGSTEIIMRSLELTERDIAIHDNEMYNFPILYYGLKQRGFTDHFSLSATVVALEPAGRDSVQSGHLLVATLPSLLFDYYLPKRLADRLRGVIRFLQGRFLIGQMYTDGRTAARYALRLDRQGEFSMRKVKSGESDPAVRNQIAALRRNLEGSDFAIPPFPLMQVTSSYHYTGGFGFGNEIAPMDERCEVLPGLHACDSVVFPDSPAQPPTFTIMANAMRVATLAMG